MKKVFYKRDNVELLIDTEPFASGGEGNLYRIRKPIRYSKFVVKLYHQAKRTDARQRKVEYMITNPPIEYIQQDHYSVIWPQGLIFERSGFAGFLMPFARGEKLEILSMPRIRKNKLQRWGRFDFSKTEAMQLRLKICYNIAAAVYQVHATDHYVLVDLKTDNIIIQPNGLISIVDMDSVEIIDGDRVWFPATVTTPEYTPPEYYTKNVQPGKQPIYESWDLFSLAIIFYKLLFGIHPYAASAKPPFDKLTSLHQKIESGLFVHSTTKSAHFKVVPPPHRKFETVNPAIQSLFLRSFEEGHDDPESRPDADEWCWAIAPSPRMVINRDLPSRVNNIGKITYSKPLNVTTDVSQLLPSVPPPRLPKVAPIELTSSMAVPRGIAAGVIGLLFIWATTFGLTFSAIGFVQLVTFFTTSMGLLYAYFHELPETKQQRLITKELKQLRKERKQTNQNLLSMKTEIARLPNRQKQISYNFEKEQKRNLIKEKKEIEHYIKELRQFLSEQDKKAIDLLKEEVEEIQALQKSMFGDIYKDYKRLSRMSIEEQLEWLKKEQQSIENRVGYKYRQKIEQLSNNLDKEKEAERLALKKVYDAKIQEVELEIQNLSNYRKKEVERITSSKMIKVGEQLRKYNIRDNAATIFSDSGALIGVVCDYLERNGIRSAADFIDVDAEGKVKKINAKNFEKVPFLTPERGLELKNWLSQLRKDLGKPEQLTREESAALDTRFSDKKLKRKIQTLKTEYFQASSELRQEDYFEVEKQKIEAAYRKEFLEANQKNEEAIALLTKHQADYEAKLEVIKERYNALQDAILSKSEAFSLDIKAKVEQVNEFTFSKNKLLLESVNDEFKSIASKREMGVFVDYNSTQQKLNDIDNQFYSLKVENEQFKNISFETFLKGLVKFK